jgi:Leucine-rich repeat (LRR) protein
MDKAFFLLVIASLIDFSSQSLTSFKCEHHDHQKNGIFLKAKNFTDCKIEHAMQVSFVNEIIDQAAPTGLWEHPNAKPMEIGALIFVNSSLMKIPTKVFGKFRNLHLFCACDVQLRLITRDDFVDAGNLRELRLKRNLLTQLEDGTFANLKNLQKLDLSGNLIRTISEETFVGCSESLERVDLSFNKIKEIDFATLAPLAHIKKRPVELFLNSNEINQVKESHRVSHLLFESLNLKENFLKSFSCPDVKIGELHLENNQIETISFDNCSVEYMKISGNNLKWLHIHEDMKGLIAAANKIESFVVSGDDSQMYHLELTENGEMEHIFPTLKLMSHIQYLNLSNSIIGVLHEDTFARMTELKYLFLRNSGIQIIPFGIFGNNKQVMTLDLSDNDLESIDLHMFTGLDQLKTLNLSGNRLSQIEGIEKIRTVLPELKVIGISGNNWKCLNLSTLIRTLSQLGVSVIEGRGEEGEQSISGIGCY